MSQFRIIGNIWYCREIIDEIIVYGLLITKTNNFLLMIHRLFTKMEKNHIEEPIP